MEELVCSYTKSALREGTLGIGLLLKRSPITGEFLYVNPTADLMGMRCFRKLNFRRDIGGKKFTHWLPLYFGESEVFKESVRQINTQGIEEVQEKTVDLKQRFEQHFKMSINFLTRGSSRLEYTAEKALNFLLKLIGAHVLDVIKETVHPSVLVIRRLFNFLRLMIYLIEKHPRIQDTIEQKVGDFMKDEVNRHKDNCPNLLDILIMVLFSQKVDYQSFKQIYFHEQVQRQVNWILLKIPELDFQDKKAKAKSTQVNEDKRSQVSFGCGKNGYHVSLFFDRVYKIMTKVGGQTRDTSLISK